MENNETLKFTNSFGSVTDKRIMVNNKKGLENISIDQISSIRFKHQRNYVFSIGGFAVGFAVLFFMINQITNLEGVAVLIIIIIAIVGILSGIANWVGDHIIVISIGDKEREPIQVPLSKTREGRAFYDAIAKEI